VPSWTPDTLRSCLAYAKPARRLALAQVADEHSLDINMAMANAPSAAYAQKQGAAQEDDIAARLANLQGRA